LGRESKNGRTYSDKAMDDAAKLYEGTEVNIDHDRKEPHRERGLLEGFGVVRGSTRKTDGVYGDLHFLKTHPAAPLFLERAERFPQNIGLSHNADGKTRREKSGEIVESIDRVNSIDLVRNPATNRGLFESSTITARQILETLDADKVAATGLLEMAYADAPTGAEGDMSSDQQMLQALEGMLVAVVRNGDLDMPAKRKQIDRILKAFDSLSDGEPDGDGEPVRNGEPPDDESEDETKSEGDKPKKEKPMSESVKTVVKIEDFKEVQEKVNLLESENALLKKRDKARGLMKDAGLPDDEVLLESLVALPNEAAMKKLCDREKEREATIQRASKVKPFIESTLSREKVGEYPKSAKDFAAALR
jgi:hypothetical protein